MIEIRRYESRLLSSNMYVVVDGNHAVVIDPFEDTVPSVGLIIDYIFLTHEHYDHISGVSEWKKAMDVPVVCSNACANNICDPRKNLSRYFRDFCDLQTWVQLEEIPAFDSNYSCFADETFDDVITIEWLHHQWRLFEIPGHSQGSIGILLDNFYFFSGDSLIENMEIELKIPGGSKKRWKDIGLPRLNGIPNGIIVCPGHFNEFRLSR